MAAFEIDQLISFWPSHIVKVQFPKRNQEIYNTLKAAVNSPTFQTTRFIFIFSCFHTCFKLYALRIKLKKATGS